MSLSCYFVFFFIPCPYYIIALILFPFLWLKQIVCLPMSFQVCKFKFEVQWTWAMKCFHEYITFVSTFASNTNRKVSRCTMYHLLQIAYVPPLRLGLHVGKALHIWFLIDVSHLTVIENPNDTPNDTVVWTIRTIHAFAFEHFSIIREW